jgi:hypothetical protein
MRNHQAHLHAFAPMFPTELVVALHRVRERRHCRRSVRVNSGSAPVPSRPDAVPSSSGGYVR